MKSRSISRFMVGVVISFTIEILVMTIAVAMTGSKTILVSMIGQAFALAICCALVGAVCSADKLNFLFQAVLTYIFALATVLLFSYMFRWSNLNDGIFSGKSFYLLLIMLFTLSYTVTMILTWLYQKKKKKLMNDKLAKYKENVVPTKTGREE